MIACKGPSAASAARLSVPGVPPRRVAVDELVGIAEIAERLDVRPVTVHAWRARHSDFPAPLATLSMGLLWAWPDIEAWARRSGRLG